MPVCSIRFDYCEVNLVLQDITVTGLKLATHLLASFFKNRTIKPSEKKSSPLSLMGTYNGP